MTDEEFEVLLARAVWKGSIPAMRLYVDRMIARKAHSQRKAEDPLAFADELAARRRTRPEAS